jgi:DNA-directed RNA polymerase subunit M/transcription elongation factor TFIIS
MKSQPKRPRVRRDDLPIYEWERFRCPKCTGLDFKMRSKRDPDQASTQWRTCLTCGFRFVLIVQ